MTVSPMLREHWPAVRAIYLEGIATGDARFQQTAPEWDEWDAEHLPACRLVALDKADVVEVIVFPFRLVGIREFPIALRSTKLNEDAPPPGGVRASALSPGFRPARNLTSI
jgi:hypothetical protein